MSVLMMTNSQRTPPITPKLHPSHSWINPQPLPQSIPNSPNHSWITPSTTPALIPNHSPVFLRHSQNTTNIFKSGQSNKNQEFNQNPPLLYICICSAGLIFVYLSICNAVLNIWPKVIHFSLTKFVSFYLKPHNQDFFKYKDKFDGVFLLS